MKLKAKRKKEDRPLIIKTQEDFEEFFQIVWLSHEENMRARLVDRIVEDVMDRLQHALLDLRISVMK